MLITAGGSYLTTTTRISILKRHNKHTPLTCLNLPIPLKKKAKKTVYKKARSILFFSIYLSLSISTMKCQFLICLVVLFITITSAKPVKKRGLLGNTVGNAVNTISRLLFHGRGTFFDPEREGGSQGACGPFADENSQIVAMNADQYGDMSKKSHWCGKRVKICYEKKCTIATVTDACPGCDHGKNIHFYTHVLSY